MAQDPRALLQQVFNPPTATEISLNIFFAGRQSSPKCRRRLQPVWRQDRKVRESSRPLHPSRQCISSAKARYTLHKPLSSTHDPTQHFRSCANPALPPPSTVGSWVFLTSPETIGKEAGLAFERAATIQTKNLNELDDAANSLTEAYKSYRKSDPEDAARVLQQAINHYTSKGNFRRAATHQQNLAEIYEIELGDEKRAVEAYETAAGWFESDHAEACVSPRYPHSFAHTSQSTSIYNG